MSAFTDEELKALKESLNTYENEQQQSYRVKEFKALLARLEAAEMYCEHRWDHITNKGGEKWEGEFLTRWRETAGKDTDEEVP